jgi:hypothetical protein
MESITRFDKPAIDCLRAAHGHLALLPRIEGVVRQTIQPLVSASIRRIARPSPVSRIVTSTKWKTSGLVFALIFMETRNVSEILFRPASLFPCDPIPDIESPFFHLVLGTARAAPDPDERIR